MQRNAVVLGWPAALLAALLAARAEGQDRQAPAGERTTRPSSAAASSDAIPLSSPKGEPPLTLARPGGKKAGRSSGGLPALGTALGSLAAVLALFFAAAWALRRGMPRGTGALPADVVEILGRAPLPGRQQMHLIRCGNKLLLVWANPHGVETLTEITDPVEVDRLTAACRQPQPHGASTAFQQVFQQISREPVQGLLEENRRTGRPKTSAANSVQVAEGNDA